MPYYHIKISRKRGRPSTLYLFDLSKDSLESFLKQARMNATAHVPQMDEISWIETKYINAIRIAKTSRKSSRYGIGYMKGENVFEKGKDITEQFVTIPRKKVKTPPSLRKMSKKVFVVHGKDHKLLNELKIILKDLQLAPIVLHEQPSGSRTIVEKLEKYSDVGYAFIILTPDDLGCSGYEWTKLFQDIPRISREDISRIKKDMTVIERELMLIEALRRPMMVLKTRARQNVVLEFGYFIGKLGRDRVCCLYKGDVELPSDMHGIVYIPFKESVNEVRDKIAKELKAAGYEIKM